MSIEEKWWYLSFADETSFRGAAVVRGFDIGTATANAHLLKINPGGQVLGIEIPDDALEKEFPESRRNRLITEAELRAELGGKKLKELEAEGVS